MAGVSFHGEKQWQNFLASDFGGITALAVRLFFIDSATMDQQLRLDYADPRGDLSL